MDINNLKYIVGKAECDKPATIRFFGSVCKDKVDIFVREFLYLQDEVRPSKINVLINSEGGSVIYGMSVFSVIQSCPIKVDCIIEGIAASMGSVIWAAGNNQYMHDYSLVMIHNPFNNCGEADPSAQQAVNAFKSQLSTIYRKRFNMSKDKVAAIMDGEEGNDGTFFDAKSAVEAGLIPAENIIKTSKKVRDKVKCELEGISDYASIRDVMSGISCEIDENKLVSEMGAIHNQKDNKFQKPDMEQNENFDFDTISAQLGISKDAQAAAVTARITDLLKAEAALKESQDRYNALEIKYNGAEAALKNAETELADAKAALKKYQDAEEATKEAKIQAIIEAAVKAGKIEESSKESWVKMAHNDIDLVEATLAGIRGRDNIVEAIAQNPENVQAIQETLKSAEEIMAEKVKAHLGEVTFEKF